MPFPKGYDNGHRFSSENQPKKNGRPKGTNKVHAELTALFGKAVAKELMEFKPSMKDLRNMATVCMNLTPDQLKDVLKNKALPMAFYSRVVAMMTDIKNGKTDQLDKLIELVHGKPTQQLDITGDFTHKSIEFILDDLDEEQTKMLAEIGIKMISK